MRLLGRYLAPYSGLLIATVLAAALAGIMDGLSIGLLVPLLAALLDTGSGDPPAALALLNDSFAALGITPTTGPVVVAVLLAIAAKNALLLATFAGAFRLSAGVLRDLREDIASLLLEVGIAFHEQARVSSLVDVWHNKTAAIEELIQTGVQFTANIVIGLALFGLLFVLSWKLTLLALALSLLGIVALRWHMRRTQARGRRIAAAQQTLMAAMHDAMLGIRLIRTGGNDGPVRDGLGSRIKDHARHLRRGNLQVYAMHPVADLLGSIAIAALALLALGLLEMSPALALTILLPFLYVLLRLVPLARSMAQQRARLAQLWSQVDEVRELLRRDNKPFVHGGPRTFPGLSQGFRFQSVCFTYPGAEAPALEHVDVEIPAGKTTALVGETGSGKSTLVNLLLRLHEPDSGSILADGEPLSEYALASFYATVGVVEQSTVLFNDTVRANLTITARTPPSEDSILDAAKLAGIHDVIQALPQGYDTVIGDQGMRLSGGQRQRLAIARALLRDPEILILDEATSALDNRTENWVHDAMRRFGTGRTVIMIAHRLSTIEHADHVIVLRQGQVAEAGTLDSLRQSHGAYAALAAGRVT